MEKLVNSNELNCNLDLDFELSFGFVKSIDKPNESITIYWIKFLEEFRYNDELVMIDYEYDFKYNFSSKNEIDIKINDFEIKDNTNLKTKKDVYIYIMEISKDVRKDILNEIENSLKNYIIDYLETRKEDEK